MEERQLSRQQMLLSFEGRAPGVHELEPAEVPVKLSLRHFALPGSTVFSGGTWAASCKGGPRPGCSRGLRDLGQCCFPCGSRAGAASCFSAVADRPGALAAPQQVARAAGGPATACSLRRGVSSRWSRLSKASWQPLALLSEPRLPRRPRQNPPAAAGSGGWPHVQAHVWLGRPKLPTG